MTEAMKITLSNQPADARWGEKATYSINNDGITLHLTGKDDTGLIQRAARKIDGLGIKHVSLEGEGWDTDRSWAFWAGYKGPKGTRKIEWANLDEAGQKELESRLKIIDWVRDTINAPAEELGPEQLAQRAALLAALRRQNTQATLFAVGDDWQRDCLARLAAGQDDKIVLPEYGGEAHITKPKK